MGTWADNHPINSGVESARLCLLSLNNYDCIVKKLLLKDDGVPSFLIEQPSQKQIAIFSEGFDLKKVTRGTITYRQIYLNGCMVCWDICNV